MGNLLNSLKLIRIVGINDHEKPQKCFINHVIMAMNEGFNLLYKHREAYKTLAGMDVDATLTGFHHIELSFEALSDQE